MTLVCFAPEWNFYALEIFDEITAGRVMRSDDIYRSPGYFTNGVGNNIARFYSITLSRRENGAPDVDTHGSAAWRFAMSKMAPPAHSSLSFDAEGW